LFEAEDRTELDPFIERSRSRLAFSSFYDVLASPVPWQELLLERGQPPDFSQPQLGHDAVLERMPGALDAALGLRRVGGNAPEMPG
jgi:hypothetical protein